MLQIRISAACVFFPTFKDLPVVVGTNHTEAQIRIFLTRLASGMYVVRVMVRSVMMAMARIEKSAA